MSDGRPAGRGVHQTRPQDVSQVDAPRRGGDVDVGAVKQPAPSPGEGGRHPDG